MNWCPKWRNGRSKWCPKFGGLFVPSCALNLCARFCARKTGGAPFRAPLRVTVSPFRAPSRAPSRAASQKWIPSFQKQGGLVAATAWRPQIAHSRDGQQHLPAGSRSHRCQQRAIDGRKLSFPTVFSREPHGVPTVRRESEDSLLRKLEHCVPRQRLFRRGGGSTCSKPIILQDTIVKNAPVF